MPYVDDDWTGHRCDWMRIGGRFNEAGTSIHLKVLQKVLLFRKFGYSPLIDRRTVSARRFLCQGREIVQTVN